MLCCILAAAATVDGAGARSGAGKRDVSSGSLRRALAADRPDAVSSRDGARAVVEVFYTTTAAQARDRIANVGGHVTGEVPGRLLQAEVPWSGLRDLEHSDGISFVRPPHRVSAVPRDPSAEDAQRRRRRRPKGPLPGDEIAKMNAAAWHAAGKLGDGVKVGIIDLFSSKVYKASQKKGEVPAPAGTACFVLGSPCDVLRLFRGERHGTAVAEIVHEMAPSAQLYLGFAESASDLRAVVDSFLASGVKIVTRSLGSEYDGPGDGTGALDAVVDYAVSRGITWFNSAGNSAGTGAFPLSGAYYRSVFTDTDGDGLHEFAPGAEFLGVLCNVFSMGLRWDDFKEPAASVSDFDLIAIDRSGNVLDSSEDRQGSTGGAAPPLENFSSALTPCTDPTELVFLGFKLVAAGSSSSDVLEYQNNGAPMTFFSNPGSAAVPICDSANAGVVCVGAIDPAAGTQIADYSSQGPTNDGRIKPDLSAAACVQSFALRECFNGTSASTPAAAGAAALVLGAGLGGGTPAGLASYLKTSTTDRGVPGPDNVYGTGELILPAPP